MEDDLIVGTWLETDTDELVITGIRLVDTFEDYDFLVMINCQLINKASGKSTDCEMVVEAFQRQLKRNGFILTGRKVG